MPIEDTPDLHPTRHLHLGYLRHLFHEFAMAVATTITRRRIFRAWHLGDVDIAQTKVAMGVRGSISRCGRLVFHDPAIARPPMEEGSFGVATGAHRRR